MLYLERRCHLGNLSRHHQCPLTAQDAGCWGLALELVVPCRARALPDFEPSFSV